MLTRPSRAGVSSLGAVAPGEGTSITLAHPGKAPAAQVPDNRRACTKTVVARKRSIRAGNQAFAQGNRNSPQMVGFVFGCVPLVDGRQSDTSARGTHLWAGLYGPSVPCFPLFGYSLLATRLLVRSMARFGSRIGANLAPLRLLVSLTGNMPPSTRGNEAHRTVAGCDLGVFNAYPVRCS